MKISITSNTTLQFSESPAELSFSFIFRNAKTKEINSAYRKLAIVWHPDKHPEGPEREKAQKVFMDIAAAKEVLSDPGLPTLQLKISQLL